MKSLKFLGILTVLGSLALAAAPAAVAQHGGGGGGHSFGGGGHMSAGGAHFGGGHFGGGGHFNGGARFSGGARSYGHAGYGSVRHYGYSRGGAIGPRYAPRVGFSGHYVRPGTWGNTWHGGYWGGRYWPHAGFRSGFSWFLPVLPLGFATYWWGGFPYYYYDDAYYTWSPYYNGYVATEPPPVADGAQSSSDSDASDASSSAPDPNAESPDVFAYPKNGQSDAQAAKDRDECRAWAAGESGFDPAHTTDTGKGSVGDYRRAMGACLDARGYSTR